MTKRHNDCAFEMVFDDATNATHVEVSEWDSFPRGVHYRGVDNGDFTPGVDANCDTLVTRGEGNVRLHSASRH